MAVTLIRELGFDAAFTERLEYAIGKKLADYRFYSRAELCRILSPAEVDRLEQALEREGAAKPFFRPD